MGSDNLFQFRSDSKLVKFPDSWSFAPSESLTKSFIHILCLFRLPCIFDATASEEQTEPSIHFCTAYLIQVYGGWTPS